MTRRRRWLLIGVLTVLVAIPALLLTSATALRVGVGLVADRLDALEVEGIEGRLVSGIAATRVSWRQADGPTVTVTDFNARWRVLPALAGRLYLGRVEASSVVVSLAPPVEPPPDEPPREFSLPDRIEIPLIVRIDTLEVDTVRIEREGRVLLAVQDVEGRDLHADPRTFGAGHFVAVGDPVSIELGGTVNPAGAWPTQFDARWRMAVDGYPRLDGRLSVAGALDRELRVQLAADSRAGGSAAFEGMLRNLFRAPQLDGELTVVDGRLEQWVHAAPAAVVTGSLSLDGWIEDLEARGTVATEWVDWPHAELDAEIRWGHRLLAIRQGAVRSDDLPTTLALEGHVDWTGPRPLGNVRASWSQAQWPLDGQAVYFSRVGRGSFEFADDTGRAEVAAHFGDRPAGRVRARADLAWYQDDDPLRIDASADWESLELFGVASDVGRGSAQGSVRDWAAALVAHLAPPGAPAMNVSADVDGDAEGLRARNVHAYLLDGTAEGTVDFSWTNGWNGDATLRLADIDPSHFVPAWEGRVGGSLQARVAQDGDSVRWDARLHDASGTVHDRPFDARADVSGIDAVLQRIDATASIGEAEASVRGRWSPTIELDWRVSAPDLAALVPGAAGRFRGEGYLRGTPEAPALGFDVDADEIAVGGVRVARLSGEGDVDLAGERGARAILRAHAIVVNEQEVDAVELSLSGPREALTLALRAHADDTRVALRAGGAWDDDRFDGRLEAAQLVYAEEAPWSLADAAGLEIGAAVFRLDQACWRQAETPNELCIAATWRDGVGLQANAGLTGLPLAELSAWLPLGFQYSGRIGGEAALTWPADGEPEAEGRLAVVDGSWRHLVGDESIALMQWHEAVVEGVLRAGDLDARAAFTLVDGGQLEATLRSPVFDTDAGPAGSRPLHARLTGEFSDFDLIPALVPDIAAVSGRVSADLTVGGTRDQPLFEGQVDLVDGTTTIPRLGLRLTDLGLSVGGDRDALTIGARARSGPGTLAIDGRFRLEDGRVAGEARVRGDDFEAARVPEAHVRVSPQLTVGISGHAVNLDGEVRVPYARLAPGDFAGTIDVSADEILLDDPEPIAERDPWRVSARVRVTLGDVQFEGYGLTARITGGLTAIDAPGEVTRAVGELQVQEGRYEAWGQNLEIEHGRLVFTGGPITEPGVDVLAVRRPQDVTVGVNVRGTLRDPEMRLYSEPTMPQAEQLSWLVLGTPLGGTTGSERALLDRTRDTAQLAGGDLVVRELGRRVGLSDVGIERGDTAEEAALVIGHYLSPRVYVGYGIGIWENPANSIRLRFHIDRNWSIEAETGERATSTDIRFTIER